jgi:hypothetical protein
VAARRRASGLAAADGIADLAESLRMGLV